MILWYVCMPPNKTCSKTTLQEIGPHEVAVVGMLREFVCIVCLKQTSNAATIREWQTSSWICVIATPGKWYGYDMNVFSICSNMQCKFCYLYEMSDMWKASAREIWYPLVIKRGHGKPSINEGFNGKVTCTHTYIYIYIYINGGFPNRHL